MIPIVLTIAGSDSSAGAGIQADLKAISANGGYGASVITAITAQNTRGVTAAAEVDLDLIRAQADAVFGDLRVAAVKTGMLASAPVIETVAKILRDHRPPHYVLDPVMISKTGFPLLRPEAVAALSELLLPAGHPRHAERPRGARPDRDGGANARPRGGGRSPPGRGGRAGGARQGRAPRGRHGDGRPGHAARACGLFPGERVDARHTHGTGCTFSAAIATQLAHGRRPRGRDRPREGLRHRGDPGGPPGRPGDRPHGPLLLPPAAPASASAGSVAWPGRRPAGEAVARAYSRDHRRDPPGPLLARRAGSTRRRRRAPTRSSSARSARGPRGASSRPRRRCAGRSRDAGLPRGGRPGGRGRRRRRARGAPRPGRRGRGDGAPGSRTGRPDRRHREQPRRRRSGSRRPTSTISASGPVFGTRSKANPAPALGSGRLPDDRGGRDEARDRDRQRHGRSGGRRSWRRVPTASR